MNNLKTYTNNTNVTKKDDNIIFIKNFHLNSIKSHLCALFSAIQNSSGAVLATAVTGISGFCKVIKIRSEKRFVKTFFFS
jgi:GTP cyclohydrolase I